MTTFAPSEYRAHCNQCGFETKDFDLGDSRGVGVRTGPQGHFDSYTESYAYLRVRRRNLLCRSCGTLHQRQDATTDCPLLPTLLLVGACVLPVVIVAFVIHEVLAVVLTAMVSVASAVFLIWVFVSAFSRSIRAKYSDWVKVIESPLANCPSCGATDTVDPTRVFTPLPCPNCRHKALTVACTFKGYP